MLSERFAKVSTWILRITTFIILVPVAAWIADPLATRQYDPSMDTQILLLWPDHIELRKMSTLAEVSPRPGNAAYSFMIPPDRLAWVRDCLKKEPHGSNDGGWMIRIKQLNSDKQWVQLQIMGDGYRGMEYEASPERIIPLKTRLAGSGLAFIFLAIAAILWVILWTLVYLLKRTFPLRNRFIFST